MQSARRGPGDAFDVAALQTGFGDRLLHAPRHTKLESTVRYLGVELDDALQLSGSLEI